jgi:Peptidase of plants and bacteria
MDGVAYTTGSELDNDHKEIHFSLSYISKIPKERCTDEVTGVVTHELVHCYQWNGLGTCPGGLVEGIADWVRLSCDLSPPHWKREASGDWDSGYQRTAYFLDYLETRFGEGTVRRLNESLRNQKYEEKKYWTELLGRPVDQLWSDYTDKLREEDTVIVNKEDIPDDDNPQPSG